MEELETKLKGVRMLLQEKVQQLKEQVSSHWTPGCPHTFGHILTVFRCVVVFVLTAAGEELKVQPAVEGSVHGELSADEGSAGHRAAAEKRREEELPVGGES